MITYKKIEGYNLDYRDKQDNLHPVKFISYIWKRIDGFIIDSLKKELSESNFYNRYNEYKLNRFMGLKKERKSNIKTFRIFVDILVRQ